MSTSDPTLERVVHAVNTDGSAEIVRYDRAGKWFAEFRRPLAPTVEFASVADAARTAVDWEERGGTIYPRQYGGTVFVRLVDRVRSERL